MKVAQIILMHYKWYLPLFLYSAFILQIICYTMMKVFRQLCYCCALLALVAGCSPSNSDNELWFYTSSTTNEANELPLKPSHFLYLQGNGNYTCDFGVFEYGQWKRDGNKIILTSGKRDLTVLQVLQEKRNTMQFLMKGTAAEFEAQPAGMNGITDPFAIASNKWRVHAEHKENEAEIKARLLNHCQFWEAYFNWAIEYKLKTIDVRSTPTPIKIYGNGIGLKSYADLPEAWRGYFYDSTDCKQATEILKDVFRKHDIDWPKDDNTYVIFKSAFAQLQKFLQ